MASTFTALHYHIIFSTHSREPNLASSWRGKLHEYIGGLARSLGGYPDCIGGVSDHVHMLVSLKSDHRVSDFMRDAKKRSSLWVCEQTGLANFRWQKGYAAFTVSASARESVREYILNQEEHHRVKSFTEELVAFLKKTGTEFDARYLD